MKFLIKNTSYWMIKNFDLLSIILVTCLTWLSRLDLSRSTSIILKEPLQPQPIFVSDFVQDFPAGNLSDALFKFTNSDVILIYLYSHWDEESISFKSAIEQLAETIKYKIPVVAVNCWNNQSNCYNAIKPNRFPQLYAFVSNYFLVEYKRTIEPNELFNFANSLFYPFHFPRTKNDLDNLFKLYDATLILCLNSQSKLYSRKVKIFHQISSLYKGSGVNDPNIGFIVLSETDELFIDLRQSIGLSANEAILFSLTGLKVKFNGKFVASEVLRFLSETAVRPIVNKYSPTGVKSLNSQELLKDGVLVIYIHNERNQFIWDNVKSRFDFYALAVQMRKCYSKDNWSVSIDDLIKFKRELILSGYLQNLNEHFFCKQYQQTKISTNATSDVLNIISSVKTNNSRHFSDYVTDPFVVSSNLMEIEWTCRKHSISLDYHLDRLNLFLETPLLRQSLNFDDTIKGPCQDHFNRSIHFAELNGNSYPKLLENWGISMGDNNGIPRVIVVDWKNEIVHHMTEPINQRSLNDLVSQLSINNLTVHMKSDNSVSSTQPFHAHMSPIDANQLDRELNDPDSDLVVYYYTPWCAYCSSLSNLLVMLSRYFAKYPSIHFSSLNTFGNDLPCKYQSERVPALIMYPRGRKSESVVFHITDENISLSSLIRFVLENSGDLNLNLNSPSPNFNDNHNVTCDRTCLESAEHTIVKLYRNYRTTLRLIDRRLQELDQRFDEICSLADFGLLEWWRSRDWRDYRDRQVRARYQGRLVSELNDLSPRRALLTEKIKKLSRIKKGIRRALGARFVEKSALSTASDIVNRST